MKKINSVQKPNRKKYSPQFKDHVSERADKEGVPQVASDLGLSESLLCQGIQVRYAMMMKKLGQEHHE